MGNRRNFKRVLVMMLIVSLLFTINIPINASESEDLKDFEAGLKDNATLNNYSNEDDVVNFITKEGEKVNLGQEEITKAVKDFFKSKTPNDKISSDKRLMKKDNSLKNELNQIRNKHDQKRIKLEQEIQKYVDFDTNENYEENIKFLLDNKNINLDKEQVSDYICSYYETLDSTTKQQAEEFLGLTSENL